MVDSHKGAMTNLAAKLALISGYTGWTKLAAENLLLGTH
jgi:hypothetical protein